MMNNLKVLATNLNNNNNNNNVYDDVTLTEEEIAEIEEEDGDPNLKPMMTVGCLDSRRS